MYTYKYKHTYDNICICMYGNMNVDKYISMFAFGWCWCCRIFAQSGVEWSCPRARRLVGTFRNLVRNKWFNDYRWLSHVQHHAHHNKHGVGCEFAGGPLLYKWPRNRTTTNIATTACIDQDTNRPMCTRHGNATPAKRFDELQLVHVGEVHKLNTFHRADCFEYPANLRNFGRHFGRCRKTWKRLEDILEDVIWPRECLEDVVIIFKIKNF